MILLDYYASAFYFQFIIMILKPLLYVTLVNRGLVV